MPDWFDKQTLGDLLNQAADRFGPREALMYEGQRWTFDEFRDEVDRVARALINLGIQPGDKVSIWMPNRAEWLFLFGRSPRSVPSWCPLTHASAPATWNTWSITQIQPR